MKVILLTRDLMFPSRIRAITQRLSLDLEVTADVDVAVAGAEQVDSAVLMVDLELPGIDPQQVAGSDSDSDGVADDAGDVAGSRLKRIAYAPHGQIARLRAARDGRRGTARRSRAP